MYPLNQRFTLFICLFLCLSFKGQKVASFCQVSPQVMKLYKNDADRLAIRRVEHMHSTYKDSVRINKEISANYLDALLAVYNATALPANDTVTRLLNIHSYNPGMNSLIVLADSNLLWMINMRNTIFPTRDYAIDKMMDQYHFEKAFYSGLLQPSMVVFRTDSNSNLAPLARKVKNFLGVTSAESDFLYGDGNDIKDSITADYMDLTYSYGWQECPTGCELRRFWIFRIYPDHSVEYLGSHGSLLEPSLILNVEENEALLADVKVYANPAKNKLYIESSSKRSKGIALSLENKKGEVVYALDRLRPSQEVDLILLSNGIYRLKLKEQDQEKVYKILKR